MGYLLVIFLKKIISNIFLDENYEIFLSLPIKIKDILLSKIIIINITILSESFFILLSLFGLLYLYKVKFYAYIFCIFSYFITNLLFTLYTYIISIIYLKLNKLNNKIKYGIFFVLIVFFTFSLSFKNLFIFTKKVFLIDLIITSSNGNSNFKQSFIIGNLIFVIFFIIFYSLLIPNFTDIKKSIVFFIALTNIFPSASIIATCLPQNLISIDGQDLELIKSLSISFYDIMKSKILVAIIINSPLILVSLILNIIFHRNSLLLILLSLIATLLTYGTFVTYSIYIDAKNPNFAWFNSKDLVDDFLKNFKIIGFSALLYIPPYLLNIIFKENYMLILLPTLFNIYLLVTTYNKLKIKMENIFCCK